MAAEIADCSSASRFAVSEIGPENFREYSVKEEIFPMVIWPNRYSTAPNPETRDSDRLLINWTVGPTRVPW